MSNYPTPTADSAISGLHPITDGLTEQDLLIISIKLNDAYYTGKISLEQLRQFVLEHTVALEISGLIELLDAKSNVNHTHGVADIVDMTQLMATKANTVHTHTTAQITGLSTLLDGKANTIHSHDIAAINGLVSALTGKANNVHAHEITDVIGLKPILDSFQDWTTNNGSNHEHQISQIVGLDERFQGKADTEHNHQIQNIGGLTEELQNKADVGHTHTAADFENIGPLLNTKADIVHSHNLEDVGGLELALDDKADKFHRHGIDDVDGLRNELNDKAPSLHNHGIASIDGLDLELNNKSNLDHTHMVTDVEGLGQLVSEKANIVHGHNVDEIVGLDGTLDGKANTVHSHSIEQITGLRSQLDTKENLTNKVNNLDVASDENYPSVNGVISGVNQILANHIYPVSSVNGLSGDVVLSKENFDLDQVDNTADKDKPISEPMRIVLDSKVEKIINSFDPEATPGRVVTGDDYLTIIQKLQWQIDVLRGIFSEPAGNVVQIIPNGYSLKLIFEKEVKFRNNALSSNNFNASRLFDEVVINEFIETNRISVSYELITIEAVGNELTITLEPNWINPTKVEAIDSVENGGTGTGIIPTVATLNFRNLITDGGALIDPIESEVDLTIHTNLSEKGLVHDSNVYERVVILGTWAGVPHYGYVSPSTLLNVTSFNGSLSLEFNRDVLMDDVSISEYNGTGVELFTRIFKDSAALQLITPLLVESAIEYTVQKRSITINLHPGFISNSAFEQLDEDFDGVHELELEVNIDQYSSIDGEEIILSSSPTITLTLYSNASASGVVHTPELYQQITVLSSWDSDLNYNNIPAIPVTNLTGDLMETVQPVSDLTGAYVDE